MRKLVVVSAGLSDPSTTRILADRIAEAVDVQVSKRGEGLQIEYVELRELAVSLGTVMSTGLYDEKLRTALDTVSGADGLIAATPVFAASYSGLFKMFFDALDKDALTSMPVIIAATVGTPRHSLVLEYAMRPLFSYLRATVMSTAVFAATEDFGSGGASGAEMHNRVVRAARELAEYLVDVRSAVVGFGPDFGANAAEGDAAHSAEVADGTSQSADKPNYRRSTNTQVDTNVTDFATLLEGLDGSAK
ncbi:FMN reductase [uncultured Corynebacterium sp.]|uniref:FMN reductase n=1 Tax=uncultured Corynebacterium sp. TaxID=159447 RepID=UPI002632EB11|nr:FMN reductase [uncultured Corynebacterium sp.]